jgi:hypothetical protein
MKEKKYKERRESEQGNRNINRNTNITTHNQIIQLSSSPHQTYTRPVCNTITGFFFCLLVGNLFPLSVFCYATKTIT